MFVFVYSNMDKPLLSASIPTISVSTSNIDPNVLNPQPPKVSSLLSNQPPKRLDKTNIVLISLISVVFFLAVVAVIVFSVNQGVHFIPATMSSTGQENSFVFIIVFGLVAIVAGVYLTQYTTYTKQSYRLDQNTYKFNKAVEDHKSGRISKDELKKQIQELEDEQKTIYGNASSDNLLKAYGSLAPEEQDEIKFGTFQSHCHSLSRFF